MTAREAAVAQALAWVGKANAHADIIDLYNRQDPLPRAWRMRMIDDWCAATCTAVSVKLGYLDIMPGECSVGQMMALYQGLGRWVEDDAYTPIPGDLICYDWQDDGVADNLGWPDHVGMVVDVSGTTITVVEGNMSGGVVGTRYISINARYIRGYCCPDYERKGAIDYDPIQAEVDALPEWARNTVQRLVDRGILEGTGEALDLSRDMLRMLVVLDRAGVFNSENTMG